MRTTTSRCVLERDRPIATRRSTCYCQALDAEAALSGGAARSWPWPTACIGEREKAIAVCEEWVSTSRTIAVARHTLAAVSGRTCRARAPTNTCSRSSTSFADSFEAKLARLHYRAPTLVARGARGGRAVAERARSTSSTSAAAPACAARCWRHTRGGWSASISREGCWSTPREKQVYDELVPGGADGVPAAQPGRFDVIVTADTLVYFGALEAVAAAAAAGAAAGRVLIFTVEEASERGLASRIRIRAARPVHARRRLRRAAAGEAGLEPVIGRARSAHGVWSARCRPGRARVKPRRSGEPRRAPRSESTDG